MIYFITGNKKKFEEVKAIIPDMEQLDIDLPEIQEIDAHEIIKAKLHEAFNHKLGEFIVEDTSLYLECLNGLPGPLIKWFLKTVGNDGLAALAEKLENKKAVAKTIIGYAKSRDEIHFFEGVLNGSVVKSESESQFGWDPIFLPEGSEKVFGDMSQEEKNQISMRAIATNKLKEFLFQKEAHDF
jgi:non-canonical purine NTP pyrophosphatase (RdgB/HAM1 family)